jgi:hypothetical protein
MFFKSFIPARQYASIWLLTLNTLDRVEESHHNEADKFGLPLLECLLLALSGHHGMSVPTSAFRGTADIDNL